jgi:signal transduction histidine kinase
MALLEDYSDRLDERARQYLSRIRAETQRMGQLIDDLLKLSRVTRAEMRPNPVDLTALAESIAARLQEDLPHRQLEFVIQQGLSDQGDERLLRIALNNLLGNAVKFTSKQPQARIEFGLTYVKDHPAYFVRDNGAGFDMAFAKKLFGAFQRMHKASEFPGTGIGLATVQRIIQRHGGRIWAEAHVNQGAIFYFTLDEAL